MGDTQTTRQQGVQVPSISGGLRIGNWAIQAWVDAGDGNGPTLQTLYLQNVAAWPVDPNGNPLEKDELAHDYDWKRMMLDELRAIRVGMQRLNESRPGDVSDYDLSLIEEAHQRREELDDRAEGSQGQIAPPGAPA